VRLGGEVGGKEMKILYAGDSPVGGPANYLLGILKFVRADFTHVPPSKRLSPSLFKRKYDAIVLSDFPRRKVPSVSERAIVEQVKNGTGLLMVGGWASFSGPFGGWKGSAVEKLLPVTCLGRDDRVNFPSGAWIFSKRKHPAFRSLSFKNPPVICGLNRVQPKKGALTVLTAKTAGRTRKEYPLLVVGNDKRKRVAALATDLAPHWCGGLVDWGRGRMKLSVRGKISVEVGESYVRLVASILRWLTKKLS
jgi:uncharacterized membrane protein